MLDILFLLVGITLVVGGAGFLVEGGASLGKRLGVSSVLIGLSITAFGTSVPEFFINVFSAFEGSAIGVGDAVGASIANISLIIGVAALMRPLSVKTVIITKHLPIMLLAVVLLFVLGADKVFQQASLDTWGRQDGFILLVVFAVFLSYIFERVLRRRELVPQQQLEHFEEVGKRPLDIRLPGHHVWRVWASIAGGVLALVAGSQLVIVGGSGLAEAIGVNEVFVGLVFVALGTTLPELTTSIVAIRKNQPDIAVGNAVGSVVFNLLFVVGVAGLIGPIELSPDVFRSLIVLLIFVLVFRVAATSNNHRILQWEGAVLLLLYITYVVYITLGM